MTRIKMVDSIKKKVTVQCSVNIAFKSFTQDLGEWWPEAYSWSQEGLDSIAIENKKGGRCTERGPFGFQLDWGRVLEWSPSERLVITWQIGSDRVPQPNPENASTVEITFKAISASETIVSLVHKDIQNHGDGAQEYRDALNSEKGWQFILNRYVVHTNV